MSYPTCPVVDKQRRAGVYWRRGGFYLFCTFFVIAFVLYRNGSAPQLALASALGTEAQVDGTQLYVAPNGNDANPGTQAQPLRTIQRAIDRAVAGTTVFLRQGTYHEIVKIDQSGTTAQPIVLAAFQGERPVIDGQYTLPDSPPVRWNNTINPPRSFNYDAMLRIKGSHIIVRGIEITRSAGRGIVVGGRDHNSRSTNVTIEDCSVHDVRNSPIQMQHVTNSVVQRCNIYHGSDYAIHDRSTSEMNWPSMLMVSDASHVIFRGNTIRENWGEGVSANEDSTDITIEDNTIYDNMGQQLYVHRSRGVIIQRNLIYHSNNPNFRRGGDPSGCIALNNESDFAASITVEEVDVRHNVVVGCRRNMALWSSDQTHLPIHDVRIVNNTFVNAFSNTARGAVNFSINANNLQNIVIENNVIVQTTTTDQFIGNATSNAAITYRKNLWSRTPPANMSSNSDLVVAPGLNNPYAALSSGGVQLNWYAPNPGSPAATNGVGAIDIFNRNPGNPTPTPAAHTPTATPVAPTPTATSVGNPGGCARGGTNALTNGSFEERTKQWYFATNGRGSLRTDRAAYDCTWTARLQIDRAGSTTKFYQKEIQLEPNTRYLLHFAAFSNSGHDLNVDLQKNGGTRTDYGIKSMKADLQTGWRVFYIEFTTKGFTNNVKNARLQFSLSPYSSAGDVYWLDRIVLEKVTARGQSTLPDDPVEHVQLVPVEELLGASSSVIQGYVTLATTDGSQRVPDEDSAVATLIDTATNGENYQDVVESDEAGFYTFAGMPAGDYQLSISPPPGYLAPEPHLFQVQAEGQQEFTDQLAPAVAVIYLPIVQE